MSAQGRARIIVAGVVRPMTAPGAHASALAIRDGRIVAVGELDAVRAQVGPDAIETDLGGRAVLPGFIDAHHHLGFALAHAGGVDLEPVRSLGDLLERVRRAAASIPRGEWLLAQGYDPHRLLEGRAPTRAELDEACPEHPALLVDFSLHAGVANTRALAAVGFDGDAPDPPAGRIERDRRGSPTGGVVETAMAMIEQVARESLLAREPGGFDARLGPYQERLLAHGITRLCDAAVPPEMEWLLERARDEGRLRIPVVMMPVGSRGFLVPPRDRLDGSPTGEGDGRLAVGPLKLFFDGGTQCATCLALPQLAVAAARALGLVARSRSLAPLAAARGVTPRLGSDRRVRTGIRYHDADSARALVGAACERGFAVAIHAIGNEAVEQAIDAHVAARRTHSDRPPPRIEHAILLTPELARRAADHGIALVMQPDFVRLPAYGSFPMPGGLAVLGLRTALEAGVRVAGSSDAPCAGFDPLDGIRSAVRRRGHDGGPLAAAEAIGAEEAVALYTREAAHAVGASHEAGTLEVGKRADLVVLSADPCTASGEQLDALSVEQTWLAGERVHLSGDRALVGARDPVVSSRPG